MSPRLALPPIWGAFLLQLLAAAAVVAKEPAVVRGGRDMGICFPAYYSFLPCEVATEDLAPFSRHFLLVDRREWADGMVVSDMLGAADARPLILYNTPVDKLWKARAWTPQDIVDKVSAFKPFTCYILFRPFPSPLPPTLPL